MKKTVNLFKVNYHICISLLFVLSPPYFRITFPLSCHALLSDLRPPPMAYNRFRSRRRIFKTLVSHSVGCF